MTLAKKVVACIIVRLKSTRLANKALLDLAGYAMTEQLIRRLRKSKTITDIVLCTSTNVDDALLLEKAKDWGVAAYAGSEEDVLSRLIVVAEQTNADCVLRVTGDNPFTDAENIDRMVERHFVTSSEYTRCNNLPLGVTAEVMAPSMLMKLHQLMPDPTQSEYMSFFAFDPENFACQVLEAPSELKRPYYSLTIDYPEDLALARDIYAALASGGSVPALADVVAYLDKSPNYKEVPPDTSIKLPAGKTMTYQALIASLDQLAEKCNNKMAQSAMHEAHG